MAMKNAPPSFTPEQGQLNENYEKLLGLDSLPDVNEPEPSVEDSFVPTTIEDILKETSLGNRTKGRVTERVRNGGGGFEQAERDFNSVNPGLQTFKQTEKGEIRTGELPNGQTLILRPFSKPPNSRPTLQIFNPVNRRSIEIRY